MKSLNRREFMKGSIASAAAFTVFSQGRAYGANERIIIGVMGLGGRGTYLAEEFAQRPDVEIAYLCDPNTRRFARAREAVEEAQDKRPKLVQDFRKILDDPNVDALINATPDHWHGLGTI
ncbi:MAG: Gfo/Idh/MocA family oxidoreductase, partial [Sedimentisphaerales bacterium]